MIFSLEDIQGLSPGSEHFKELSAVGVESLEQLARFDPLTGREIRTLIRGLYATYFAKSDLTEPILFRIDKQIDFNWGDQSPDISLSNDNFSVEWNGFFYAKITGNHTFYTGSDDGVRLFIDGNAVIDNWTDHGSTENKGTVYLEEDKYYPLKLQYYEKAGDSLIRLSYETGENSKQIVPEDMLWQKKPFPLLNIPFISLMRYVSAAQNISLLSDTLKRQLTLEPCGQCGGDRWVTTVTKESCKLCMGTGKRILADNDTCHGCRGDGAIVINSYLESCSSCSGTGIISGGNLCPACSGDGCIKVDKSENCWICDGKGIVSDDQVVKCSPCSGQGMILTRGVPVLCEICKGKGSIERKNLFSGFNALEFFTKDPEEIKESTGAEYLHINSVKECIGNLAAFIDDNSLSNFKMEVE